LLNAQVNASTTCGVCLEKTIESDIGTLDGEGMPRGEPSSMLKGTDTDKMGTPEILGSSLGVRSVSKCREGGLIRYALFDDLLNVACF